MAIIDFLKNGSTYVYPITLTTAIYKLDGTLLDTWMGSHTHSQYSLTSHNHDSVYSKLNHTHNYLPLSGGTLTGGLAFTPVDKSEFLGVSGIVAANDYWRVGGAGTNDNGYMEIATADNGNEPIYVRQYQGAWLSIQRTLTLLDSSGNSQFPGQISEAGTTLANKYAAKSHSHSYLPLSGGVMSGNINLQNNYRLQWAGYTDNAEIYFNTTGDSDPAGGLYFDLGDDWTPTFFFRIKDITNNVWRVKASINYNQGLKLFNDANYYIDEQKGLITAVQSGSPSTKVLWAW